MTCFRVWLTSDGAPDEAVREAFAPSLCNIMWHYFTHCQLLEATVPATTKAAAQATGESSSDDDVTTPQASMQVLRPDSGDALASEDTPKGATNDGEPHSPDLSSLSTYRDRTDSESTSSTSAGALRPSEEGSSQTAETSCHPSPNGLGSPVLEMVDRPRISASVFTALLGALLADMQESVAACARFGFMTLLCRLTGQGHPDDTDMPWEVMQPGVAEAFAPLQSSKGPDAGEATTHKHRPYTLTEEAKQLIVKEMIDGIVLALARLDATPAEVENEDHRSVADEEAGHARERSTTAESSNASTASEDDRDEWADVPLGKQPPPAFSANFVSDGDETLIRSTFSDTLSDLVPYPSAQDRAAEEAAMGRQISMSLIASIAQTGCFDAATLADKLLPEVAKMPKEAMNHVRQQASLTLGVISSALPVEVVVEQSLPLLKEFANDAAFDVRRQACIGLPSIVARLTVESRQMVTSELIAQFADDPVSDVREAATQVLGKLIYAFHEDEAGVPAALLQLFLEGSPRDREAEANAANESSASIRSISSDPDFTSAGWATAPFLNGFGQPDAERPYACAFNFPAVVLTVGANRWSELREFYHGLASPSRYPPKVRRSLACSLHEVARIIGPEQASVDLADVLAAFLDDIPDVTEAVLEHAPSTLECLRPDVALKLLPVLEKLWEGETASIAHWRMREKTASHLAALAPMLGRLDEEQYLMRLLSKALRDQVAAVRDAGVAAVSPLLAFFRDG